MTNDLDESLFSQSADGTITPTAWSRGPWSDDALHGGPVSALLAHLCESEPTAVEMQPTRLTVELLSPVPLAALTPVVRTLRAGQKINLVEAEVRVGDRIVASARLARIRTTGVVLPNEVEASEGPRLAPAPGPRSSIRSKPTEAAGDLIRYHSHSTEHRFARGGWADLGPSVNWVRLLQPVFPELPITPLVRVAAASDFGNGISTPLPFESWLFINPDLNIHLHRLPEGDWVALDAHCFVEPNGIGQSNTELFDERGRIGHANQSLLVDGPA